MIKWQKNRFADESFEDWNIREDRERWEKLYKRRDKVLKENKEKEEKEKMKEMVKTFSREWKEVLECAGDLKRSMGEIFSKEKDG